MQLKNMAFSSRYNRIKYGIGSYVEKENEVGKEGQWGHMPPSRPEGWGAKTD